MVEILLCHSGPILSVVTNHIILEMVIFLIMIFRTII